jgi:hypothetical protein
LPQSVAWVGFWCLDGCGDWWQSFPHRVKPSSHNKHGYFSDTTAIRFREREPYNEADRGVVAGRADTANIQIMAVLEFTDEDGQKPTDGSVLMYFKECTGGWCIEKVLPLKGYNAPTQR